MRNTKAAQYESDWEYEQAKRQERKRTQNIRKARRTQDEWSAFEQKEIA